MAIRDRSYDIRSKYSLREGWKGMRQPSTKTTFVAGAALTGFALVAVEKSRWRAVATGRRAFEVDSIARIDRGSDEAG